MHDLFKNTGKFSQDYGFKAAFLILDAPFLEKGLAWWLYMLICEQSNFNNQMSLFPNNFTLQQLKIPYQNKGGFKKDEYKQIKEARTERKTET